MGHDVNADLKVFAIAKAIENAREHYEKMEEKPVEIAIYTDSPDAALNFSKIRATPDAQDTLEKTLLASLDAAEELNDLGVKIEVCCLPAHLPFQWKKRAGEAASSGLQIASKLLKDQYGSITRAMIKNGRQPAPAIF